VSGAWLRQTVSTLARHSRGSAGDIPEPKFLHADQDPAQLFGL
jgi:hypothetical protein